MRPPAARLHGRADCGLAGVSRAGYYRHLRPSAPRQEETVVRDAIQRLALANRHYGYRRIAALLRREGWGRITSAAAADARGQSVVPAQGAFVPMTTNSGMAGGSFPIWREASAQLPQFRGVARVFSRARVRSWHYILCSAMGMRSRSGRLRPSRSSSAAWARSGRTTQRNRSSRCGGRGRQDDVGALYGAEFLEDRAGLLPRPARLCHCSSVFHIA